MRHLVDKIYLSTFIKNSVLLLYFVMSNVKSYLCVETVALKSLY